MHPALRTISGMVLSDLRMHRAGINCFPFCFCFYKRCLLRFLLEKLLLAVFTTEIMNRAIIFKDNGSVIFLYIHSTNRINGHWNLPIQSIILENLTHGANKWHMLSMTVIPSWAHSFLDLINDDSQAQIFSAAGISSLS